MLDECCLPPVVPVSSRYRLRVAPGIVPLADMYTARPPPKRVDPVYQNKDHLAWRQAVLRRAGGRCEWRDEDDTPCGRREARMFADHITELADGGARLSLANGQCLCGKHHTLKTNRERARRHGI